MKVGCKRRHAPARFVMGMLMIVLLVSACGGSNSGDPTGSGKDAAAAVLGQGCKKVGVLLPEATATERWEKQDRPLLTGAIRKMVPGMQVDVLNAQGNATNQQKQAEQVLNRGNCILVVAPVNGEQAATIVESATQKGVPVIAYDRLIQSDKLAWYVGFDSMRAGELQGQYIADNYQGFAQGKKPANVVMINGPHTDNQAQQLYQGAVSKLDPLIKQKELKKSYETFVPDWSSAQAQTAMEQALSATKNDVQMVNVANDEMANAVIAVLEKQKLNGRVLVTGQDATMRSIQNIVNGDQTMTVYRPAKDEANATAQLVAAISKGQNPGQLTQNHLTKTRTGKGIPSLLQIPVAIDKSNLNLTVIADGYVTKKQICQKAPPKEGETNSVCQ